MEKPLYKCMTKATNREAKEPRYSQNWVAAKRASFQVFEDKFVCGKWEFNFNEIKDAILYETKQVFIPVKVLKFEYDEKVYQFGFNPWANPMKYANINYKTEKVKLKYSIFSIVCRVILFVSILYILRNL